MKGCCIVNHLKSRYIKLYLTLNGHITYCKIYHGLQISFVTRFSMHGYNLHRSGVVAAVERTFEPLKEQSFTFRATKWGNLLPNSPRYYIFLFFFREFMGICGINSRAIQRLNVIFWGDFCIKVKLAATLSFFTAVVHPIVVSASLCMSFFCIYSDVAIW